MSLCFHRNAPSRVVTSLTLTALVAQLILAAGAWAWLRAEASALGATAPSAVKEEPAGLTIDVGPRGEISLNGEAVKLSELEQRLAPAAAAKAGSAHEQIIAVRVDGRSKAEGVNRVVERLKAAGLRNVRILVTAQAGR